MISCYLIYYDISIGRYSYRTADSPETSDASVVATAFDEDDAEKIKNWFNDEQDIGG